MRWKGVTSHLEPPPPPPSPVVSSDVFWEVVFFNLLFFLFCSLWSDCHRGAFTVNFHLISGWWKWGRCVLNRARLQQLWSAVALMKFYQQSQRELRRPAAIQSPHGGHKRLPRVCVWKHLLNYSCSHQALSAVCGCIVSGQFIKVFSEHLARKLCPAKLPTSQSHLLRLSLGFLSLISCGSVGMKCFHHKTFTLNHNHTSYLLQNIPHPSRVDAGYAWYPTRPSPQ